MFCEENKLFRVMCFAYFLIITEIGEISFVNLMKLDEFMLDDTDRRILRQMMAEPEGSATDLADRAGVTASTLARRLGVLRKKGVLKGTRAEIYWPALGYEIAVSLRVTLEKSEPRAFDEFIAAARDVPEVLEIQTFLGVVDVRLEVIARDMAHYQQIYRNRLLTLPHLSEIDALMHLSQVMTRGSVPL